MTERSAYPEKSGELDRQEARHDLPLPSASFAKSLLTSSTAREIVYTTSGGPCKAFVRFVRNLKYMSLISQFGVTRIENSGSAILRFS